MKPKKDKRKPPTAEERQSEKLKALKPAGRKAWAENLRARAEENGRAREAERKAGR